MRLFLVTVAFKRFKKTDRDYMTARHVVMAESAESAAEIALATGDRDLVYAHQTEDLGTDRSYSFPGGRTTRAEMAKARADWTFLAAIDLQPERPLFRIGARKED